MQILKPQSPPLYYSNCFELSKKLLYRAGVLDPTICTSSTFLPLQAPSFESKQTGVKNASKIIMQIWKS